MSREPDLRGHGFDASFDARGKSARWLSLVKAVVSFIISLAAGFAFLWFYWTDQSAALLGISLALALGGVGAGLVFWAHGLMPDEEVSDARPRLSSTGTEKDAFMESFTVGENKIARRRLLGWLLGSVAGLLAIGSISMLRSLGKSPLPVLFQTVWEQGTRLVTMDGQPVPASLEPGSMLTVFPEGFTDATASQTLLLRVDPQRLDLPAGRQDWAPKGFLAYSKICTHAGCPVAQFERTIDLLLCPCHQSAFEILRGAVPVGGPASRPLPQLPLYEDEQGFLRAGGDFSAPPGPSFWSER